MHPPAFLGGPRPVPAHRRPSGPQTPLLTQGASPSGPPDLHYAKHEIIYGSHMIIWVQDENVPLQNEAFVNSCVYIYIYI